MLVTVAIGQPASAESAKSQDNCYQYFQGSNSAAFAMWFRMLSYRGSATAWVPDGAAYPVGQSRTIDLGDSEFAEGTAFRYEGSAALGSRFYSDYYEFCRNGHTKTLFARGTTLNNWWAED